MRDDLSVLQKCLVDTDNVFVWGLTKFRVPYSNKDYKVYNTARQNKEDYTNTAKMIHVYVCVNRDNALEFLNENFENIFGVKVLDI